MNRLERDRAAALEASKASQAKAKRETTKIRHTPGPWEAVIQPGCHAVIASLSGGPKAVAIIGNNTPDDGNEPMRFANARLIAESPNLVLQLLSAANYIDALGGDSKSYRAAIARATGEQP